MSENVKVTDARGVPTMKALWMGIVIDGDDPPNRHLVEAGLEGKELFLELVEAEYAPGEILPEDADMFEGLDYGEEEEAEDPECDRYPDGCQECQDHNCNGPDQLVPDDEETYVALDIGYREKPDGEWLDFPEEQIGTNPALCRFLNALNDAHGL